MAGTTRRPVTRSAIDSFHMDRYEMTQAEFERVGKDAALSNPSHFKGDDSARRTDHLAVNAAKFCNARSQLDGLKPCYNENDASCDFTADGYRLPTEAEWEYACRAGTRRRLLLRQRDSASDDYAWYDGQLREEDASGRPEDAQRLGPLRHARQRGRVVQRRLRRRTITPKARTRIRAAPPTARSLEYVLRGGSWKSTRHATRSSYRLGENPGFSDACLARDAIGFRCVRRAVDAGPTK